MKKSTRRYLRYRMRRRRRTTKVITPSGIRRRRRIKYGDKPEIKYRDISVQGAAIYTEPLPNPPNNTLYAGFTNSVNMLSRIVQGTDYGQRIGNKIFLMKIKIYVSIWLCVPSGTTMRLNTGLVRHIISNPLMNTATDADTASYWSNPLQKHFEDAVNRKTFTVLYDKTKSITSGYPNDNVTSSNNTVTGAIKNYTITLPINRYVTYNQAGYPKEDYDQFSFTSIAKYPNSTTATSTQTFCMDYRIRMWYRDA